MVQLASMASNAHPTSSSSQPVEGAYEPRPIVGMTAVILQTSFSGFASVFFERMLKRAPAVDEAAAKEPLYTPSVWARNVQLAGFGILFSLVICFVDMNQAVLIEELEGTGLLPSPAVLPGMPPLPRHELRWSPGVLFDGFTPIVWLVVVLQVLGGLLVALVIKYADNIGEPHSLQLAPTGTRKLT